MISVLWHLLRHPVANDGPLGKGSVHTWRAGAPAPNWLHVPGTSGQVRSDLAHSGTILYTSAGCCCFSFYQQLRGWVQPPHRAEDLSAAPVWVGSVHTFETPPVLTGWGRGSPLTGHWAVPSSTASRQSTAGLSSDEPPRGLQTASHLLQAARPAGGRFLSPGHGRAPGLETFLGCHVGRRPRPGLPLAPLAHRTALTESRPIPTGQKERGSLARGVQGGPTPVVTEAPRRRRAGLTRAFCPVFCIQFHQV